MKCSWCHQPAVTTLQSARGSGIIFSPGVSDAEVLERWRRMREDPTFWLDAPEIQHHRLCAYHRNQCLEAAL